MRCSAKWGRGAVVCAVLLSCLAAHADDKSIRERIEWTDLWVADADKADLPRVLLVGDSIARGYYDAVAKELDGKAYCARYTTSKFIKHDDYIKELRVLLETYRFDVIHFNNGLHGWGYTEDDYADSFDRLLCTFHKYAPDAKLIWGSSTAVRNADDLSKFDERNERVRERNRIAADEMRENNIPVDDLYALVEPHADWYSRDGVHFNDAGRAAQGKQVADQILKHLP